MGDERSVGGECGQDVFYERIIYFQLKNRFSNTFLFALWFYFCPFLEKH